MIAGQTRSRLTGEAYSRTKPRSSTNAKWAADSGLPVGIVATMVQSRNIESMADPDPRRAVIEHLTQPASGQLPLHREALPGDPPTRPVASVVRGNPFTADPDSIEFLKERAAGDRRLFAVTFDDQFANHWFWLVAAELDDTSWSAHGVAGGSDGPAGQSRESPARSRPWLNLCGQWGTNRFYAGGKLHAAGARLGHVCLTLADGTELRDTADDGVALFISDLPHEPAMVDIYEVDGQLLVRHKVF